MTGTRRLAPIFTGLLSTCVLASAAAAQCQSRLMPGPFTSMNGSVRAIVEFDDGRKGLAVYLGGAFTLVNGSPTMPVLRWWPATGAWESVGSPRPDLRAVNDLIVFDDGRGPALYAGLSDGSVQRWTGARWIAVGESSPVSSVSDLAVVDLGAGPRLIAGKARVEQVMVWNNAQWIPLASPTSALSRGSVHLIMPGAPGQMNTDLNVFASTVETIDPSAPAGGATPLSHHVSWNGVRWLDAAATDTPAPIAFHPDAVFFDHLTGNGPQLHLIEGRSAVFRFDADARRWSALPSRPGSILPSGFSLAVFDDGSGPRLYADTGGGLCRYESNAWAAASPQSAFINEFLERWPVDRMASCRPTPTSPPILVVAGHYRLTGTGAVNVSYLTSCAPCPADFDHSGAIGVRDLFAYLQAWFPGDAAAEFDGAPGITVNDLFAFLDAWRVGCQ